MFLPPGIYLINNRATGYFLIEDNGTEAGVPAMTIAIDDEVPNHAKISVQVDAHGLYTFKSDSGLCLGDSGRKSSQGNDRYLEWQDGNFKWQVESAGAGLWNIKVPNDPRFVADISPPPPPPAITAPTGPPLPTVSIPIPIPGSSDFGSPSSGLTQQTDSHIVVNISFQVLIPYSNSSPTQNIVTSSARSGLFANSMSSEMTTSLEATTLEPVIEVTATPIQENLVLKKHCADDSIAKWQFINAGSPSRKATK